jgi:hypothetical protein
MAPTNYDDLARQVIEGRLTDTVVQAPFADYHCPHGDKDDWASDCHQCQCAESRKAIVAVLAPDYAALTQARDDYREAFEEWQARAEAAEAERDALAAELIEGRRDRDRVAGLLQAESFTLQQIAAERDALRRVIRPVIAPATIAISDSGCTCDNCKDALASLDELDRLLAAETGGTK